MYFCVPPIHIHTTKTKCKELLIKATSLTLGLTVNNGKSTIMKPKAIITAHIYMLQEVLEEVDFYIQWVHGINKRMNRSFCKSWYKESNDILHCTLFITTNNGTHIKLT